MSLKTSNAMRPILCLLLVKRKRQSRLLKNIRDEYNSQVLFKLQPLKASSPSEAINHRSSPSSSLVVLTIRVSFARRGAQAVHWHASAVASIGFTAIGQMRLGAPCIHHASVALILRRSRYARPPTRHVGIGTSPS